MYTGIVQAVCSVKTVTRKSGLNSFIIDFNDALLTGLKIGASVAVDGVCLTVTTIDHHAISFDAMQETLNKTTLGNIIAGDKVNIERSARAGDEVGGHILSGHIEGTATIKKLTSFENNHILEFVCPIEWMKYILPKGFIAVNGASLTLVDTFKTGGFSIHLIPETLRATTFGMKKQGDMVNIEIDNQTKIIVTTVERYMQEREQT
jgi:riboflavin synthase